MKILTDCYTLITALFDTIDKNIIREDGKSIRIKTDNGYIDRYHELYKIEQAYRISKNDLQTRPIFHFKEEPIKLHILICFIALVISKHIELKKGTSIRKFIDESRRIVDGEILNHITQKIVNINAQPSQKMKGIIAKLELPH